MIELRQFTFGGCLRSRKMNYFTVLGDFNFLLQSKCERKRKLLVGTRVCVKNCFMARIKMMLLHLPTQIFFPTGGDRVTCRGSKLTNSRGRTNLDKGNNKLNSRRARQVVPLEIAFFAFLSVFELEA